MTDSFPADYRAAEVDTIASALEAGECVSIVGLSGAGKSNLLRFVAACQPLPGGRCVLVDCNRLAEPSAAALFRLVHRALGDASMSTGAGAGAGADDSAEDALAALEAALAAELADPAARLCLLLDRFDSLLAQAPAALFDNLRALRDAYKFRLTYVTATRRPLPEGNELAELFHRHTLWLGPLAESDARWTVARYASRHGLEWGPDAAAELIAFSGGYPSLLRAACEAYARGARGTEALAADPAVQARLAEFRADVLRDAPRPGEARPDVAGRELRGEELLARAGLANHPLLRAAAHTAPALAIDPAQLTAKEQLLLDHLRAHAGELCSKDDLIRAVWPEDRVFERGVRDDSLAQLVRRLREKVEPEPGEPRYIQTVPGRGYRFVESADK
jgi:DNA-binding response OmpR family regulator